MSKTILFADDEEDIRYITDILLRMAGYTVQLESDTLFADNLDKAPYPDLYLLDRHMNGEDLLETCKRIKAHPRTKHIPVIMVSADPTIKNAYKNAGADDLVAKPFERAKLLETIERLLTREA